MTRSDYPNYQINAKMNLHLKKINTNIFWFDKFLEPVVVVSHVLSRKVIQLLFKLEIVFRWLPSCPRFNVKSHIPYSLTYNLLHTICFDSMSLEGYSSNSFWLTWMSCTAVFKLFLFLLYWCVNLILILILIIIIQDIIMIYILMFVLKSVHRSGYMSYQEISRYYQEGHNTDNEHRSCTSNTSNRTEI